MAGPTPLEKWPADDIGPRVTRGTKKPRAIAWFGFSAFWGHLRHLVASVIATENIDSRQWMIPEAPDVLLGRVLEIIGPRATRTSAQAMAQREGTLAEAMGGEVWIDYVSDCGDDVTVSETVARMFVAEYEVDDPEAKGEKLVLPRGDILFLGGDLAYPVATVLEMTRRLVEPWNRVLEAHTNGGPRVLLAVPGNHDWYDGLDGFSRLCQAPCAFEDAIPASDPLHPEPEEHPVLAWAEAFARGDQVKKPTALALAGYLAVQRASYFRMPLAPGIDLFAVDRQLKRVDPRQQAYFAIPGAPARATYDKNNLLRINEPFDRAWRTVGLALDRSGFTVEDRDRSRGLYFVRYADPLKDEKKDAGFLSKLKFWSGKDDKAIAEQYLVSLIGAESTTRIAILNKDGKPENSETSNRILTLLEEQLK